MTSKFIVSAAGALLLAGCGSLGISTDKVDYKQVVSQKPLDVPPELAPLPANDRYTVPGVATASGVQAARPAAAGPAVAPVLPNARLERAGGQRWLAVDLPPEQVFPVVRDFWASVGLAVEREDPKTGIVETGWAENRAKLPDNVIRRTLGRLLDPLYSTGEQDRYRARVERTPKNTSEVYVSHRGMIEVYTSAQQDRTRWQPRPADPELEAEMLQRLLLRFAPPAEPAVQTAAAPSPASAPAAAPSQTVRTVSGPDGRPVRIEVDEPFDRAWRRVGLGLDRGGFTVEDRDRTQGVYFVRYLDPEAEAKQREAQGFFSKMFGSDPRIVAQQYRVQVAASGNASAVTVLDKDGKPEGTAAGERILTLLTQQLR
jgi:outer membrane protein assembly factor BamC